MMQTNSLTHYKWYEVKKITLSQASLSPVCLFMCLLRRHFEFILPLINFHALSFVTGESIGNRLNTSTFSELSRVLSNGILPWVPSVLLLLSSSLEKKKGRSLRAHLCRSFSFWSIPLTEFIFRGVTQERITSSPTSMSGVSWTLGGVSIGSSDAVVDAIRGVAGSGIQSKSSFRLAKASASIVGRPPSSGRIRSKFIRGSWN